MFNSPVIDKVIFLFDTSNWFGLFPFSINSAGYFQFSLKNSILSIMSLLLTILYNVLCFINYFLLINRDSWVMRGIIYFGVSFQCFYPVMSYFQLFFRLHEFNDFINRIKLASRVLFPVRSFQIPFSKIYLFGNLLLLTIIFVNDACSYLSVLFNIKIFLMLALRYWVVFLLVVLVEMYSVIVGILTSMFKLCNDQLLLLFSSAPRTIVKRLERLAWAHNQLCECAAIISRLQSFQILCVITMCYFVIIIAIYMVVNMAISGPWNSVLALDFFCWCYIYASGVGRILVTSVNCKNKVIIRVILK
nr:gustatory receptor 11 [Graphosoma rubrolineatum]